MAPAAHLANVQLSDVISGSRSKGAWVLAPRMCPHPIHFPNAHARPDHDLPHQEPRRRRRGRGSRAPLRGPRKRPPLAADRHGGQGGQRETHAGLPCDPRRVCPRRAARFAFDRSRRDRGSGDPRDRPPPKTRPRFVSSGARRERPVRLALGGAWLRRAVAGGTRGGWLSRRPRRPWPHAHCDSVACGSGPLV